MDISFSEKDFLLSQGCSVIKVIGQGSYSKVYLCEFEKEYPSCKREIACKVVDPRLCNSDFIFKFFPRELEIIKTLQHPNVIKILGVLKGDEKFFIFMRFAENKDLLEYVVTNGRVPEPKVRFWTWQMASALSFMHSKNIVHRDLKCENILLTAHSNIKICDFGFGKILEKEELFSQTWCGSLAYAPPEILEMKPYNAKKVDCWALGVILHVALTKFLPFQAKSIRAMLAVQKKRIHFRGKTWDFVSPFAKTVLLRLLEIDPKYRWTPDSILACTWLTEDWRLAQLSGYRPNLSIPTVDQRRLSSQLKENYGSFGSVGNRIMPAKFDDSFNFFEGHDDSCEAPSTSKQS